LPLESAARSKAPKEGDGHKTAPSTSPVPASCADEVHARNEARQEVQAAFTKYHTAIEQLRGEHPTARAADTLKKADTMLREIREKSDRILSEMGACPDPEPEAMAKPAPKDKDNDDEDRDENDNDENDHNDKDKDHKGKDEAGAHAQLTVIAATRVDADPLTMRQVAERAVAAMETVFNLAKSAATATPAPTATPTPRLTEKPKPTERAKVTPTRKPETRHGPEATRRPERD